MGNLWTVLEEDLVWLEGLGHHLLVHLLPRHLVLFWVASFQILVHLPVQELDQ